MGEGVKNIYMPKQFNCLGPTVRVNYRRKEQETEHFLSIWCCRQVHGGGAEPQRHPGAVLACLELLPP